MEIEISKNKTFKSNLYGILEIVGGGLCASMGGVAAIIQFFRSALGAATGRSPGFYLVVGFGGGTALLVIGIKKLVLVSRTKKLIKTAAKFNRLPIDVRALAKAMDRSRNELITDIRKMIRREYLPTAVLDVENNALFFEENWEGPRVLPKPKKELPAPVPEPEKISTGNESLDEVLTAGLDYMNQLSALSMKLTNWLVLDQLQEIMNITGRIFDFIKNNPEKIRQIRQFMNYYLPTTVKLLTDYEEMSRHEFKGENMAEAMKKIENVMSKIKQAFQNELDRLYEDKSLNISVDIDVMEQIMKDEGISIN